MSRTSPFAQVDVFSSTPYRGNPVAVVLEATGVSDEAMQRVARWTNLSETTFVLPPISRDADYRVRIWTPNGELPFAGHPTLGTAHAWLEHGGRPRGADQVVQECGAGLVRLRRDEHMLSFAAPPVLRTGDLDEEHVQRIAAAFGIGREQVLAHQWVDNGPGWAVVQLATAREVLDLEPDLSRVPDAMVGAVGAHPAGSECAFELRAFAPGAGVPEDPVTGSLNASVAQWLISTGAAPTRYRVAQGTRLGRDGRVDVTADADGTVWIGGPTITCFHGTATL